MNFGQALEALKDRKGVTRAGWNGRNQVVWLNEGNVDRDGYDREQFNRGQINGLDAQLFHAGGKGTITRMPNFVISTAQQANAVWAPSTTDALAEDWVEFAPPVASHPAREVG